MAIKTFKEIMAEKIELSKYREIYKKIGKTYKDRYKDWFNGKWRIYLPLSGAVTDPIYQEINNALSVNDYEIADWKNGIAKSKKSTRTQRIGRLLTSLKRDDLLKKFNERFKGREVSTEENLVVVISRHPYDIAGQSYARKRFKKEGEEDVTHLHAYSKSQAETDEIHDLIRAGYKEEGWTSCKHLVNGSNHKYLETEIDDGMLVAYVITATDKNIQEPISRLVIVPIYNEDDEDDTALFVPNKFYGKSVTGFMTLVQDWLDEHQGEIEVSDYCINDKRIYNDDYDMNIGGTIEQLREALEENKWEIFSLDNEYCKAYTYWMSDLDDIFLSGNDKKRRPDTVSRIFDDSYLGQDVPESWKYYERLTDMLKNIDTDTINAIRKKYEEAGGQETEWEDIVDDLPNHLDQFTEDLRQWFCDKEELLLITSLQEQYVDALRGTFFALHKDDSDRWRLFLGASSDEYNDVMMFLNGEDFFFDRFSVESIESAAYDDTPQVDESEFSGYILDIIGD